MPQSGATRDKSRLLAAQDRPEPPPRLATGPRFAKAGMVSGRNVDLLQIYA